MSGYNVAPRYTAGSPALVDYTTAIRVAEQERDAFEPAREGIYGAEDKLKAETLGLDLIVFEMRERPTGWEVHDMITGKNYWWPFVGECPKCRAKRVPCRRGRLEPHTFNPFHLGRQCDGGQNGGLFVGYEITDERPRPRKR